MAIVRDIELSLLGQPSVGQASTPAAGLQTRQAPGPEVRRNPGGLPRAERLSTPYAIAATRWRSAWLVCCNTLNTRSASATGSEPVPQDG